MIKTDRVTEIQQDVQEWFSDLIENEDEIRIQLMRLVKPSERAELALAIAHVRNRVCDSIDTAFK